MGYTIAQASSRTGLSEYTIRYYDKEGLLPFVNRTPAGIRDFKESDFEWFSVIECLKNTGMPIKQIKQFIDWCMEGDSTLELRLNMFLRQKQAVEQKMEELRLHMQKIEHKIGYYTVAVEAGTEAIHRQTAAKQHKKGG